MHTFVFPTKDSYITNESGYELKNFGIDEILELKVENQLIPNTTFYVSSSLVGDFPSEIQVIYYSGSVSGSHLNGYARSSRILISGSGIFSTSNYIGSLTGSFNGTSSISYINGGSGSFSGSVYGTITGSFSGSSYVLYGYVDSFIGCISGMLEGTQSVYNPYTRFTNSPELSRILLHFDLSEISKSIVSGQMDGSTLKFYLRLKATEVNEVPLDYKIYAYPLSQSWDMGIGRYSLGGTDTGVNWYLAKNTTISSSAWFSTSSNKIYNFNDYLTDKTYATESFKNGGGTWYYEVPESYNIISSSNSSSFFDISSGLYYIPSFCTSSISGSSLIANQSFVYENSDVKMDITNIAKSWLCGCVANNGIILISSLELSDIDEVKSSLKFFSRDTNTIYQPFIDVSWDDSNYVTGSMVLVDNTNPFTVVVQNLSREYKFGSIPRINVFARQKYQLKNFTKGYQQSQHITSSLLSSDTYYSIKDNESENVIIDFDDHTKLSCDGTRHYFYLDTTGLAVERYYRLLIKTKINDEIVVFDNNNIFKIGR